MKRSRRVRELARKASSASLNQAWSGGPVRVMDSQNPQNSWAGQARQPGTGGSKLCDGNTNENSVHARDQHHANEGVFPQAREYDEADNPDQADGGRVSAGFRKGVEPDGGLTKAFPSLTEPWRSDPAEAPGGMLWSDDAPFPLEPPTFDDAAFAQMRRDMATVVQDLLAAGQKPGRVRAMFGLSWQELDDLSLEQRSRRIS